MAIYVIDVWLGACFLPRYLRPQPVAVVISHTLHRILYFPLYSALLRRVQALIFSIKKNHDEALAYRS